MGRSLSLQYRYHKSRRMSDTEDVPVKSPAAKAAAKKSAAKTVQGQASSHPKYADMVATTIEAIASRGGCSRQAILKKIKEDFDVGDNERRVAINVNKTPSKNVKKSGTASKTAAKKTPSKASKPIKKPSNA